MKRIFLVLLSFSLSYAGIAQSLSPSVISSQGEVSEGNSVSLEWTLGEVAIQTIRSPGNVFTEGFHQPLLEVSEVVEEQVKELLVLEGYDITVAPNPVRSLLELKIKWINRWTSVLRAH